MTTSTRHVTVGPPGRRSTEAPLPTGATTITGTPVAGPRGPRGEVPRIRFSCKVKQRRRIACVVSARDAGRATVTVRLLGSKARDVARGRGTLRLRLRSRTRVRRSARVELRYVSRRFKGRTVARVGRTARVKVTRR